MLAAAQVVELLELAVLTPVTVVVVVVIAEYFARRRLYLLPQAAQAAVAETPTAVLQHDPLVLTLAQVVDRLGQPATIVALQLAALAVRKWQVVAAVPVADQVVAH